MKEYIAVYGPTRRGGKANGLMKGCKYVEQNVIPGQLYDLGDFPVAKLDATGFLPIICDVYSLPEDKMERFEVKDRIDKYEGYFPFQDDQSLFTRRRILTIGKEVLWVYAYHYKHAIDAAKVIGSGDYFNP